MHNDKDSGAFFEPRHRTIAAFAALPFVAIALGYAFDRWLRPAAIAWIEAAASDVATQDVRIGMLVAGLLLMIILPATALAVWFWIIAAGVQRTKQFPVAGYPVLKRTEVLIGQAALGKGRSLIAAGLIALALGGFVCWSALRLFPIGKFLLHLLP